jgi:hypothetical protein
MIIAAIIISGKDHYIVWSCAKIASTIAPDIDLIAAYPACASYADNTNPEQVSAVLADIDGTSTASAGTALNANFGIAVWLATSIHALSDRIT